MRTTELAEVEALRDYFRAAPPASGAGLREAGAAIAVRVPALPQVIEVNRIAGLSSLDELDELEPLYDGGLFAVSLDPEAGLDEALAGRGFVRGYPWHKFVRGVEPTDTRTELSVEEPRRPRDFGETFAAGYGLPGAFGEWATSVVGRQGWSCFVAYAGDRPAGVGALFAQAGVGWLGFGATLPELRGRGAQGAILAARIARAAELGLETVVTETGAPREGGPGPSYRNILRAGFEVAYERPNYGRV